MSLRLFYIFKMVYECGNMTMAAKQLYMSQPAISHAIQELEAQLSLTLFERIGKHIQSTTAGDIFYQKVCNMILLYEETISSAQTMDDQIPLRIGSSITNANTILPKMIETYKKRWKNPIHVVVDNAQSIEQKLFNNDIDIAFLEGARDSSSLIQLPLPSHELKLICGKDYPLDKNNHYSLSQLHTQSWLLREKGSAIRETIDSACLLSDIVLKPIWESVNSQSLIEATIHNLGISILPLSIIERDVMDGHVLIIPLSTPMFCANHIVYHKDKHIHKAIQQLFLLYDEQYKDA